MDSKYDGRKPEPPYETCADHEAEIVRLRADNERLRAWVEVLMKALRPFAKFGRWIAGEIEPNFQYFPLNDATPISAADFREAARVMEGTPCPECAGTGQIRVAGESGANGELTTTGPCPGCTGDEAPRNAT